MVEIRLAHQADAPAVQDLLRQLGYEFSVEDVGARLDELSKRATDPILLATENEQVLGLIALHWATMLHISKPVARITALVVRDGVRRKGVGRILVDAASDLAKQAECGLVELTTALDRTDTQDFYKAIGFTASSLRLYRKIR